MKNLAICPAGDNSIHESWNTGNKNFDTVILYYGDNDETYNNYSKNCKICIRCKGEKGKLISEFISNNISDIINYEFIWIVDDDIKSSCEDVNRFFEINKKYDLWLSQPAVANNVSFEIERKRENKILRFTNFVEVLCPCFSLKTLLFLFTTYTYNFSSWGLDFLWPKLLNYPTDKIAIIDDVEVDHTRPVGSVYFTRFEKEPIAELRELFAKFNLSFSQICFGEINK